MSLNTCSRDSGTFLTDDLCVKVALELNYCREKAEKLVDFILVQFIYKFCLFDTSYERLRFTKILRLSLNDCARREENSTKRR